jgi:hypothetical protein
MLEDTLQGWHMKAFVTECREDYNLMTRELNEGSARIGVSIMNVENAICRMSEHQHRPFREQDLAYLKSKFDLTSYLDEVRTIE